METEFKGCEVIYGDTDSVFVKLPRKADGSLMTQEEAWNMSNTIASFVNDVEFGNEPAIVIENEKMYFPFLSFDSKKKYIGRKYEGPDTPPKLEYKGVELSRRDIPGVTKKMVKAVLDEIIPIDVKPEETSIDQVRARVKPVLVEQMEKLRLNKFPLEDYLISKGYRDNTKSNTVSQVQMVRRLNDRISKGEQTATPVLSGQRVEYLIPVGRGKVFERAVDPDWFRQKNMEVDRQYYLTNQIIKPLSRLLVYVYDIMQMARIYEGELQVQQAKIMTNTFMERTEPLSKFYTLGHPKKIKTTTKKKRKQMSLSKFFDFENSTTTMTRTMTKHIKKKSRKKETRTTSTTSKSGRCKPIHEFF